MPLFNIFSSKKRNKNPVKPEIIADIHEKDSLVFAELTQLGAELNIMPLEVGDFLVNNIVIERKTFSDFISSMLSKRLIEQLKNLKQYEKSLLILENYQELNEQKSGLNPNAIRGMILSIANDWNIPVIFTKNSKETADYLFLLAKKQLKPESEITLHSRKPQTKKEKIEYIIQSFPSIGPTTAKKLLKKFRTVKNIINAGEEELKKEIGKKAEEFKLANEDY